MKAAISASLLENNCNAVVDAVETMYTELNTDSCIFTYEISFTCNRESIPFKEALKKLCETTMKPKKYQRITICRSHVLDDSVRLFQKGVYSNRAEKVTFI